MCALGVVGCVSDDILSFTSYRFGKQSSGKRIIQDQDFLIVELHVAL